MASPEARPAGYTRTGIMIQMSTVPSLDELLEHCKETGAKVEIISEGPSRTIIGGRRLLLRVGDKCLNVEKGTLISVCRSLRKRGKVGGSELERKREGRQIAA
ncbi:hypothetical protein VTK56DRAFT_999 [Thermocarpiscus australiensis]